MAGAVSVVGEQRTERSVLLIAWPQGVERLGDLPIGDRRCEMGGRIERSWSHVPGRIRLRQIRDAVSKVRRELHVQQGEPDLDLARVFLGEALPSITAAFVDERNVVEHGIQAVAGGLFYGRDQRVHLRCRTALVQPHRGKCSCAIKVPGARPESPRLLVACGVLRRASGLDLCANAVSGQTVVCAATAGDDGRNEDDDDSHRRAESKRSAAHPCALKN